MEIWQRNYNYDMQDRIEEQDSMAWNYGLYVLQAISAAFGNGKSRYPKQAFAIAERLSREEEQQHRIDKEASENFGAWAMAFNAKKKE